MAAAVAKDHTLLTMRDVVRIAGVSEQTVYNWRVEATRVKLPTVEKREGNRRRVYIKADVLVKWAAKNGVELVQKEVKKLKLN